MLKITSEDITQFFEHVRKQTITHQQSLAITSAVQTLIDNDISLLKCIRPKLPIQFQKKTILNFLHTYFHWMGEFTQFLIQKQKDLKHVSKLS